MHAHLPLFFGLLAAPSLAISGLRLHACLRVRKVGGLLHWRVGRVGGSFYVSKRR